MEEKKCPLITVVTVTYNAAATVGRTLESVASQTLVTGETAPQGEGGGTRGEVEHVVVDGLSTDGTMDIVRQWAGRWQTMGRGEDFSYVSERDEGLYHAMNKALDMARGRYIVYLNAGDTLHSPDTLEAIATRVGDDFYSVVYGETDIVDAAGHFLRHRRLAAPSRLTSRSFMHGMLVCHQSFYALTELARATRYAYAYRFSADFDWAIRLLREGERRGLTTLNTCLTLTDYLSEGLTTRNHRRSLAERFRIMRKHYGLLPTVGLHLWFSLRAIFRP